MTKLHTHVSHTLISHHHHHPPNSLVNGKRLEWRRIDAIAQVPLRQTRSEIVDGVDDALAQLRLTPPADFDFRR
jgi:hypothetical protein